MLSKAAGVTAMVSDKNIWLVCGKAFPATFWRQSFGNEFDLWITQTPNLKCLWCLPLQCSWDSFQECQTHLRLVGILGIRDAFCRLGYVELATIQKSVACEWVGTSDQLILNFKVLSIMKLLPTWSCHCLQHALPLTLMAFEVTQGREFWTIIQACPQRWKGWKATASLWAH